MNTQIERLLDNKLFQRLIEKTDVLADENLSVSQSMNGSRAKVLESQLLVENPSFLKPEYQSIKLLASLGQDNPNEDKKKPTDKPKLNLLGNLANFEVSKDWRNLNSGKIPSKFEQKSENSKTLYQKNNQNSFQNFMQNNKNKDGMNKNIVLKDINGPEQKEQNFRENPTNEDSRLTFTDRRKLSFDNNSDKVLDDLSSKMRNDLSESPSDIEEVDVTMSELMYQNIDEYIDPKMKNSNPEDDVGYLAIEINRTDIESELPNLNKNFSLKQLIYSNTAIKSNNYVKTINAEPCNLHSNQNHFLPDSIIYPSSKDGFYPKRAGNTIYDVMEMKVIFDRERTGFEETKEFPIIIGSMIAGRYKVVEFLGSAAFSKTVHAIDSTNQNHYCLKIIENNKDYFDQSIDEVKILRYVNANGDSDEYNVLKLHDFFYYKEHLILVTELLKDNLYEYYRFNIENEETVFFDLNRLKTLSQQILKALSFLHDRRVIHCDVKPENLMIKSYSKSQFKLIDFGSACFIHDHLSSYVQSRFYRAPEIILGCQYDYKIDVWAFGCVLVELFMGKVLFQGNSMSGTLAKIIGTVGPLPKWMIKKGKQVDKYFVNEYVLVEQAGGAQEEDQAFEESSDGKRPTDFDKLSVLIPKKISLKSKLRTDDSLFLDFLQSLLSVDPNLRPTAREALAHSWLQ